MAHGRDTSSEAWRRILEEGDEFKRLRWIFKRLPSEPRCQMCHAPFRGFGGVLLRAVKGLGPSSLNPRYCNDCELIGADYPGGAEVDVAMLFADLRGSTSLAEQSTTWEYTAVIDRFYREAARVLIESDALIEKLIGDAVTAIFVSGLAGPQYAARAIEAGRQLLEVTGGPTAAGHPLPVGIGVHFGRAFVGAVGESHGVATIGALGDTVNVAARLSDRAAGGEMLVSRAVMVAAGLDTAAHPMRRLDLKGRTEPVDAFVLTPAACAECPP